MLTLYHFSIQPRSNPDVCHWQGDILCFSGSDGKKEFILAANETAYHASKAPKCAQCNLPIVQDSTHDGRYYSLEGDLKVHSECYDDYKVATAPRCFQCGEVSGLSQRYLYSFARE